MPKSMSPPDLVTLEEMRYYVVGGSRFFERARAGYDNKPLKLEPLVRIVGFNVVGKPAHPSTTNAISTR